MAAGDQERAGEGDLAIPICVDTAAEAVAVIAEHHDRWREAQAGKQGSGATC